MSWTVFGDMVRINFDLRNTQIWHRRRDGAYLPCQEPMDWLEERDLHYRLSDRGKEIQDAAGYDGYKYGGKDAFRIISETYMISHEFGDMRLGPDSDLYSDPTTVWGPIAGYYWFHVDQKDTALLFKLTWG